MKQEDDALGDHAFFGDPASREDNGLIEELLRQLPVVGGGPAADIALTKEGRNQHPRIVDKLLAAGEIEWHRNIEPVPDAPKPALLAPSRQELRGTATVEPEGPCHNIDRHHLFGGAKHGGKPGTRGRQRAIFSIHSYTMTHEVPFL